MNAIFLESKFAFFINLWISKLARSIIDHPEMRQFSKKSKFVKRFQTIAKSCKGFIHICLDEEDSLEDELNHYLGCSWLF